MRDNARGLQGLDSPDSEDSCHMKKSLLASIKILTCLLCVLSCHAVYASQDQPYVVGSQLPPFTLPAPDSQEALNYLGLKTINPYTISEINAKLVLVEILSALCPNCHANAPIINRLYQAIQKDADLARDVKIIGICIGNEKTQIDAFRKSFNISFPLFPDEKMAIAEAMDLKETPTMVLATREGKVLWSHSGAIQDFDGMLKELKNNHKKQ